MKKEEGRAKGKSSRESKSYRYSSGRSCTYLFVSDACLETETETDEGERPPSKKKC